MRHWMNAHLQTAAHAAVGLAMLTLPSVAQAQVNVEAFELDNGMTFLLLPRAEQPNNVSAGWLAEVGSVIERPGITGIWQVEGRSRIAEFDEWVRLDLQYIDNWSLMLDFKILLKTIPTVLLGRGAH